MQLQCSMLRLTCSGPKSPPHRAIVADLHTSAAAHACSTQPAASRYRRNWPHPPTDLQPDAATLCQNEAGAMARRTDRRLIQHTPHASRYRHAAQEARGTGRCKHPSPARRTLRELRARAAGGWWHRIRCKHPSRTRRALAHEPRDLAQAHPAPAHPLLRPPAQSADILQNTTRTVHVHLL